MAPLKKKEKRLVAIAGGAVIFFVLNQFVCGESEKPKVETAKKVEAKSVVVERTPSNVVKRSKPRRVKKTNNQMRFTSWGRDPFWEAFRLAQVGSADNDSSNFVLRGVIWKGDEAHVLIGDAVLKVGERSGDLKILDIDKNRVVCKKGSKVITLVLQNDEHL